MRRWWVVALAIGLVACGGATATPTVDVAPTQTRVVELSQIATLSVPTSTVAIPTTPIVPSATPIPPTVTLVPPTTTPTLRPTLPPTATRMPPTATPAPPAAVHVGERGIGRGFAITVNEVQDPSPAKQYSQPKEGNRWVAVDVTIENTGAALFYAQPFDVRLQDADNHSYLVTVGSAEPPLLNTQIGPNEAARGWVSFEIASGIQLATIKYAPPGAQQVVVISLR